MPQNIQYFLFYTNNGSFQDKIEADSCLSHERMYFRGTVRSRQGELLALYKSYKEIEIRDKDFRPINLKVGGIIFRT